MEFKRQSLRHENIPDGTPVRFNGLLGQKVRPGSLETIHPLHVPVTFDGSPCIHNVHSHDLETPVEPAPEPKKPEYRETEYFVETSTGALFKRQYEDFKWHFVALGTIRKSITSVEPQLFGFKRLYREA